MNERWQRLEADLHAAQKEAQRLKAENASLLESLRVAEQLAESRGRMLSGSEAFSEKASRVLAAAEQRNTELEGAARHIAELGYDRATQGVRWCRFCGRNVNIGHARKMDGDTRPCPLGLLEKALAALHDEERRAPSRAEPPAGPSDSLSNSAAQGEEK